MRQFILIFTIYLLTGYTAYAQQTFPVNGPAEKKEQIFYAFTNATIISEPGTVFKGTLVVKDGIIVQAGPKVTVPKGAIVYDLKGKFIYPGLIDIYSSYGMPMIKKDETRRRDQGPQHESSKKGAYSWNESLMPEKKAVTEFTVDKKEAEELRKLGFGAVLTHQYDGIARGTSAFVSLAEGMENEVVIRAEAATHYSFSKGSSTQDYPSSLMGCIALLRQAYLDAEWYKNEKSLNKEYNISLENWNDIQKYPQIFEVTDKLSALRADKVGDEFKIQYIIKGKGDEYQRINDIKAAGAPLIIPVAFPYAFEVDDPYDARLINIEELRHWELAPSNPSLLEKSQIQFAITTADLKEKDDFWKSIRKAIEHGLSTTEALKALTLTPAKYLKLEDRLGTLKPGMIANFLITSDSLFSKNNIMYENWVQGKRYVINDQFKEDIRGEYSLNVAANKIYTLKVSGEANQPTGEITLNDTSKIKISLQQSEEFISLSFDPKEDASGHIRLSGKINFRSAIWDGKGQLQNGEWISWSAIKKSGAEKAKKDTISAKIIEPGQITYPLTAYGWKELPQQKTYLIKNSTIWTNEEQGVMKNSELLIKNGKISAIGNNLDTTGAIVIDGTGKHISAGIIDEHSHIAISKGVNEGSQAVTSEVRIGDVINSDDVNIYRQLAGGVTAAQLLHGSANPIGGQSGIIKLRWGFAPEQMKIANADGFIKFALGENVKQANWGDKYTIRYPQSRMGVEQTFYEAFTRAREYEQQWKQYEKIPAKQRDKVSVPRRDLELDALVEILNSKRFISCHSYVQSEINMLMHVADSMGFKVNTFTHILEGYKLADKMKAHGVGASTFSDWWAYKFEVNDAIPYNASILYNMGVVTAINSDDAEMGRRLNQEAAKTVKYGGVPEEEALKMVTLNPAKLLHLDNSTGSIKVGKDADVVLWSDHPLSIYAKAEKTFVDGILFFDREKDKVMRQEIQSERARIINKMIVAKKEGEKTVKPEKKQQRIYHCESLEFEDIDHEH
jgi:imidazolonepropionase-like amidohydrolase